MKKETVVFQAARQTRVDEKIEDPGHTPADLLERAQQLQHEFWDAVSDLEAATGLNLDTTNDLSNYDIDNLEQAEE